MKKNMRLIKKVAQFILRNETGERNAIVDLQFTCERSKFVPQRSFASDGKRRFWKLFREFGKSDKTRSQTFLLNQPAGLKQTPAVVLRPGSRSKRKFSHR